MVDFFSDSGKTPDGGGRRGNAEIMRARRWKGHRDKYSKQKITRSNKKYRKQLEEFREQKCTISKRRVHGAEKGGTLKLVDYNDAAPKIVNILFF